MTKKNLFNFLDVLLALVVIISFTGCPIPEEEDDVSVTGVVISGADTQKVGQGRTLQLTATVTPTNATNKNVAWSSSNTAVATVDSNGLVTGVANTGSTTITVTTEDGSKTDSVTVTAIAYVAATGVTLSTQNGDAVTTADIFANDSDYFGVSIAPDTATETGFTATSSNTSVATVESNEDDNYIEVAGIAAGTATITVTTDDGNFTATLTVTVAADTKAPELDTMLYLSSTEIYLGFTEKLDETTAETVTNYTLSGAVTGNPTSATLDGNIVTLVIGTTLTAGNSVTVTVAGVKDTANNTISTTENSETTVFYTPPSALDTTKVTVSATSTITGSAGAANNSETTYPDAVVGKWMIFAVSAGDALSQTSIVATAEVKTDGDFDAMKKGFGGDTDMIFSSGNYDMYVMYETADKTMVFSTKVTVTVP